MTDRALIERMAKAMCAVRQTGDVYLQMARVAFRMVVNEKRRRRRAARIGRRTT